jgi:Icc-related predicted phosphoesterase
MQDDILLADKWAQIPDDVDILLTHGPPLGVMDVGHGGVPAGSATLRQRLLDIDPVLHVFGHIHGSRGVIEEDTKTTANAAYVDEAYKPVGIMEFDV